MSKVSKKKATVAGQEPTVTYSETWNGIVKGAPVKVDAASVAGRRGYSWQFLRHASNTLTGSQWVDVIGGRRGEATIRSFRPEEVTLIVVKPKRKYTRRKNV